MSQKAPGKSSREGISLLRLAEMFPDEDSALKWFEGRFWPEDRCCGHCGSVRTSEVPNAKPMPYWCSDCRSYFSIKTGTLLEYTQLPLRKWVYAIYLHLTSLKGVSSMKLHRDISISQKSAWHMLQRIRKALDEDDDNGPFGGPVEFDETYIGGKRANMSNAERRALADADVGRGSVGKVAVVGAKDRETKQVRAKVVESTDKPTLQGFVFENVREGATIYTDESASYSGIGGLFYIHEAGNHSVKEYVRDMAHTNGVESFWSMLKRGYIGIYHKMSPKHLQRYVCEYAGRHNIRQYDTLAQMAHLALGMVGKRLTYAMLIADNGLASGARG